MSSVILFRFHKNIDVCVDRVQNLNKNNPNMDIYGVGEYIQDYLDLYDAGLNHIYTIPEKSSRWKFCNKKMV